MLFFFSGVYASKLQSMEEPFIKAQNKEESKYKFKGLKGSFDLNGRIEWKMAILNCKFELNVS